MIKTAGFIFIILLLSVITLSAQPRRRTPAERAKALKEQLNLTDKQTAKVDSIYTVSDSKFQDAMQNGFDREKFRAIMDSTNSEISKLLTDKQKDAFNKILIDRRNRMQRNRPDNNSN